MPVPSRSHCARCSMKPSLEFIKVKLSNPKRREYSLAKTHRDSRETRWIDLISGSLITVHMIEAPNAKAALLYLIFFLNLFFFFSFNHLAYFMFGWLSCACIGSSIRSSESALAWSKGAIFFSYIFFFAYNVWMFRFSLSIQERSSNFFFSDDIASDEVFNF